MINMPLSTPARHRAPTRHAAGRPPRQARGAARGTLLESAKAKEVNRGTAPSVGRYAASDARRPETLDSPFGFVGILNSGHGSPTGASSRFC